ncbi:DNA damage-inducible protein din7 [Plakobranchus ocellatus]|uniref:DNA damage-inducible protein din7 n=1 Tax=Plakobranchus ocellatus TaxID=259542 RepID=A0AAV4A2Z5_9GAST|nr:DNA damage-inducible protein din7 [Plakobranchus ocellatus]
MSKQLRDAIIGLHAFTGCDSTSCFTGKGELKALNMLQGDQDLQDTFSRFGTLETISSQDMQVIETFVCQKYGKPSHTSVDKVKYDKVRQCFKGKKRILSNSEGVDLSPVPPCQDVLMLHTQRGNVQTKIWRASSSNSPDLPKSENNGWAQSSSGGLEIKCFSKDFIPKKLQDILPDTLGTDDALEKELQENDLSSHEEDISDTDDEL